MDLLTLNDRAGAHADSYYAATAARFDRLPALDGASRADVCVIGGGYTGLSAALHLAARGLSVVLLEAQRIGWGASGRNGGQICTGQRQAQETLEAAHGPDAARALWDLAEAAKATLRGLIADHDIRCDLKPGGIYAEARAGRVAALHRSAEHLARRYGYEALQTLDHAGIRDHVGSALYRGGVLDTGAGHLHPLNYALGLARAALGAGARLHEDSTVLSVTDTPPHVVRTARGSVTADHVIYACNGYLGALDRTVAARVMPINNFIVATAPLPEDVAQGLIARDTYVADGKFVVNYFRLSADRRLLFGGGESYGYRFPRDIAGLVRPNMLAVYPQLAATAIDYAWGGTLAITRSRMPFLAALSPSRFTAGGYSGQGVAMATLAGKLLAERIVGQAGRFDTLAALRHRPFPGGARLRHPLLALAMTWYAMRDRLGI